MQFWKKEKKTNPGRNGICLFKKNRSDSICSAVAGWLHLSIVCIEGVQKATDCIEGHVLHQQRESLNAFVRSVKKENILIVSLSRGKFSADNGV